MLGVRSLLQRNIVAFCQSESLFRTFLPSSEPFLEYFSIKERQSINFVHPSCQLPKRNLLVRHALTHFEAQEIDWFPPTMEAYPGSDACLVPGTCDATPVVS